MAATVVNSSADSLHLSFAEVVPSGAVATLRLDFSARLFSRGGLLEVSLRRAEDGAGVWQRVDSGEAVEMVASNRLLVVGQPQNRSIFENLAVAPAAFTPNGDGINDAAGVRFAVVLVEGSQKVEATVCDLRGRVVRRIVEERAISTGIYEMPWDGRDDGGALVPPGLYVVRLRLDADTAGAALEQETAVRTLAVAY